MADKKITELTEVTSLPDAAFLTAVDTTRATGDQNVKIQKSNLDTSISGGELEYQTEITTSTTLTTQKGLNKVYPVNSASDVVITVPQGVYSENDVINFQKKGSGLIEFVPSSGARIRGKRDRNNRYFINDSRGIVALLCEGADVFSIIGNLTTGYTGAVTTTSYSSLVDGDTGVDVQVIGSGFSSNMLVSVSSNATLNSFTVNSNTSLTLNMDAVGGVGDTVSITYDNGDEFIDVNAITISGENFTNNLVAAYKFNNNLLDYTTNSYDGTGVNNINYTTGLIGNALRLQGDDSYVTVSSVDDLSFTNGSFSWACLFRINDKSRPIGNALASKRSSVNGDKEYYFFIGTNAPDRFSAALYTDDSNFIFMEKTTTFNINQCGSGNETGTYTGMPNTNNDLYMGADQTSPTTTDINGDFNRQYFWKNRELNDAEMLLMSNRL